MNGETIDIFLHGQGAPKVVQAQIQEVLRDVLARENALPGDGELVFVGKAIEVVELEGEDTHEPVNIDLTLEVLAITHQTHVHTHAPRYIGVSVFYNEAKKRRFPTSATVARVLAWSKRAFHIDPAAGSELILKLEPSGDIPRPEAHLLDLLPHRHHPHHELHFKLVVEVNPQG